MSHDTTNYKIFSEILDIKTSYEGLSLEKISGLKRSQYHVIKMCEYYSDSRYMGTHYGNVLYPGSEAPVPFYNIVNYRVALAKTATDLDIKDFQIVSDNPKYQVHSMLLNREAYEWMKEENYSETLNKKGTTRPKYGGVLQKKTETNGKLKIDVIRWTNVWTNQNDIMGNPIVECHHMSPVEIKRKDDVWENVVEVLKAHKKIRASDRPTTIDVYETIGEFPISIYKDSQNEEASEKDEYTYSLQRYFVADLDGEKYLLFSEELKGTMEDYFNYLSWEDNGYGLGRGVIEDSEESQVWTNDAVINESIAMALAGRVGIKTNSKKLGQSVLEHDHGKIYQLGANEDINAFTLAPSALGQYQNQIEKWRTQANDATSSYPQAVGENPPSGTPLGTTQIVAAAASKPYDYKREEWGIDETKIFTKWVMPFLVKRIKKKHILVSEFSDTELETIDESFANFNSNKYLKEELLKGNVVSPIQQAGLIDGYKKHIKKDGKKRYIEIPDGYFDDIEYKVTVVTTGEQKNKAAVLQTMQALLSELVQFYQLGIITDTKFIEQVIKEMIENSGAGISPVSLGRMAGAPPQAAQAPVPSPMSQQSQPLNTATPA